MPSFRLSGYEAKVINALAETLTPPDEDTDEDTSFRQILPLLKRYFQEVPSEIGIFFHVLIIFLDWLPLFYGYFRRFSNLKPSDRIDVIERWESGRLYFPRSMILAVKGAIYMIYYSDKKLRDRIGVEYPCASNALNQ